VNLAPARRRCCSAAGLQEVAQRYQGLQRSYEGRNVWRAVLTTQQGSKQLTEKLCVFPTAAEVMQGWGWGGWGGRVAAQTDASQQLAAIPAYWRASLTRHNLFGWPRCFALVCRLRLLWTWRWCGGSGQMRRP
jgi:hypothetical protein